MKFILRAAYVICMTPYMMFAPFYFVAFGKIFNEPPVSSYLWRKFKL